MRFTQAIEASATRVKLYEACPLSYRFRYVDRIPDLSGEAARVGKLVHDAVESVCLARIDDRALGAASSEELAAALGAAVPSHDVSAGEVQQAIEKLEALAPFDPRGPKGGKLLTAEQEWSLEIGGVRFGGFFDLVREHDNGTAIEVVDWKTGMERPREEVEVDPQLGLYLAAAAALYPEADVVVSFVYLCAFSGPKAITVAWTAERDVMARARALGVMQAVKRGRFPARVGDQCQWCCGRTRCETFAAFVESEDPFDGVESLALLEQRKHLKLIEKLAAARRADVDASIRSRMKGEHEHELIDLDLKAVKRGRRTGKYDPAVLHELAFALGIELREVLQIAGSVRSGGIKKLVGDDPVARDIAERYRSCSRAEWIEVKDA